MTLSKRSPLAMVSSVAVLLAMTLTACSSNPHKAKKIETEMERSDAINSQERVGVKDGNLIVQKKVEMNEELRRLQNEVYSLEDRVYGSRKYKSQGLYGTLKSCRVKANSRELGGTGKLVFTEPIDRVTDKEDEFDIGIDERDKIVGVTEEFLKDRIARFRKYKSTLEKREDEYQEKLEICDAEVNEREHDTKEKKAAKSTSKATPEATEAATPSEESVN